jgi:hypothetical protein
MKNAIRLQTGDTWMRTTPALVDASHRVHTAGLDLFSASGLRGVSWLRVVKVLWRRSIERTELAGSLTLRPPPHH